MKLSVIILNYNVRYFLEQCILSVERATAGMDAEIIVIDNNSEDDSCEMVASKFPRVRLLQNSENVGFSKANNMAVAKAKGEYVCILNPDTAVAEDTFRQCLHYFKSLDKPGALGVYLMDGTGNFLPESKRNLPTPKRSLLKLLGLTSKKNGYYARNIGAEAKGEVAILVGAFMLLKRSVYAQVQGFDEDYFMYGEDIDLSYKLQKVGYTNYYLGSSTVLHYKGESTSRNSDYYKRFYGAMRIFYGKHFKSNLLLNVLVNVGVSLASLRRSGSRNGRKNVSPKTTYVLTEDFNLLKRLTEKIDEPIQATSKSILEKGSFIGTQFIFDVNYMSYDQIFSVMTQYAGKGNSFRIIPPNCNFIIGSDKSDQKGDVFVF